MGLKESVKEVLRVLGHALTITVHDRLDAIEDEVKDLQTSQTALLQSSIHLLETLPPLRQAVYVDSIEADPANAETSLMVFLHSFLDDRFVIEIGAQTGASSERLLKAGYEVYAVEPPGLSYNALCARLNKYPGFHALDETLREARTLACLHAEGLIPAEAGLVRIRGNGTELQIVRGMCEHRYPVVAADFREPAGGGDGMAPLIAEMRARGYAWYAVLYRTAAQDFVSFFCNQDTPVPGAWGSVFFFRSRELFARAHEWCASALPQTYFKPSSR